MSNLKNKIKAKQFVITAEIVPPLSAAGTKLLHEAGAAQGQGRRDQHHGRRGRQDIDQQLRGGRDSRRRTATSRSCK